MKKEDLGGAGSIPHLDLGGGYESAYGYKIHQVIIKICVLTEHWLCINKKNLKRQTPQSNRMQLKQY